jgi:hypothetical protein
MRMPTSQSWELKGKGQRQKQIPPLRCEMTSKRTGNDKGKGNSNGKGNRNGNDNDNGKCYCNGNGKCRDSSLCSEWQQMYIVWGMRLTVEDLGDTF